MRLGIIADDNTGASDAAGMLSEQGVRTLLCTSIPSLPDDVLSSYSALVIGTRTRSIDPQEAHARTREAAVFLNRHAFSKVQIKYCSTFDSTREGNIGQMIDAALDACGAESTIVCPALPVNGRTTRDGMHYVNGVLLSQSAMKDHPINPMTDANLLRWLGYQTARKIGLLPLKQIRRGISAAGEYLQQLAAEGIACIVTDAETDHDIDVIAGATASWKVITGGSGITSAIAKRMNASIHPDEWNRRLRHVPASMLVVSGSCSPASLRQIAYAEQSGFHIYPANPMDILRRDWDPAYHGNRISCHMAQGSKVILCTTSNASGVVSVHREAAALGISTLEAGEAITRSLALCASAVCSTIPPGRLVLSGGETSGAVCAAAELHAFETGPPLSPGVPICFPLSNSNQLVVMKSGNFGSDDLYERIAAIH